MKPLRTLIADDMPLAREKLRQYLDEDAEIDVVGECGNGTETVAKIEQLQPELVFLDVQMPDLDGFGVIDVLRPEKMPAVVFVTAYDEHALQAFEVNALDYLLKPVARSRFQKALSRAKAQVRRASELELEARLRALLQEVKPDSKPLNRMLVRSAGRNILVNIEDIDWIEAERSYVVLHVGADTYLIRDSLRQMEAKLDPAKFVRIHRSAIVNLDRVKEMQPLVNGDQIVLLIDGARLTLSRSYREQVLARL